MSQDNILTAERLEQIAKLQNTPVNSYEALMSRAASFVALDCAEEAIADYDRAIALRKTELQPHLQRFSLLIRLNLSDRMLSAAGEMIAVEAWKGIGNFYLGYALCTLGRENESIDAYTRAIEFKPSKGGPGLNRAAAYLNRAAGYASLGLMEKCLDDCEKAQALDSSKTSAYVNKALALRCLGQQDKAIKVCTSGLMLDQQEPLLYCNRAMAYFSLNRTKEAFEDIDLSIKLSKEAKYLAKCKAIKAYFLALLSGGGGGGGNDDQGRGKLNNARDLADSASRMAPENSYPWRYTWTVNALLCGMTGDFESANDNVQRVLDRHPGFIFGINIKARLLLLENRLSEGLLSVNSALTLNPKDPESNYIRYLIRNMQNDPGAKHDLKRARELGFLLDV